MKVLVVSKPVYNYIFPLVDFPANGDIFNIDSSIDTIAGEANVASFILGKYGIDTSYAGIIGNDEDGLKYKKILESVSVDTKYTETNFEEKTDKCYTIINTEKHGYSHIRVNSMKSDLTKFKYDFNPDFIVLDDKDFSGANAALNNYPDKTIIFYGKNPTKDAINMSRKADYIVCNINFASKITNMEIDIKKPKTIVNLYQRLIDISKGNWVITLGEHGVIYCNDNNVKMIPSLNGEVIDKDKSSGVFFGTFVYAIVSSMDIENAVRLANIAATSSLSVLGSTNGLMEIEELLKYRVVTDNNINNNLNVQNQVESNINQNVSNAPEILDINSDGNVQ